MIPKILPLGIVLIAILCALQGCLPWDVRRYFRAQLAYTVVMLYATVELGTKSPIYAALYAIFTSIIIYTMFRILEGKIRTFRQVLFSWAIGALVGWRCFTAIHRPLRYYDWIVLSEGMMLAACGTFLSWHAPKENSRGIYFSLGILWLALAGYKLSYTLEIGHPYWTNLNRFFPALLCFVIFAHIAWVARRRSHS